MKKKADELINRFIKYSHRPYDDGFSASYKEEKSNAIQCAIICVEEILKTSPVIPNDETPIGIKPHEYWQSVLNELKSRL